MVYFFGDVHFSSLNPWNKEAGDNFIKFFKDNFKNEKRTNIAVFLGDIAEKDVNPGSVIDQMTELFDFCSEVFLKTLVLTGNHDKKLHRGVVQTSLEFLNRFENVEVIETIKTFDVEGRKILAMPHLRTEGISLEEFYNSYDWSNQEHCDIAIGHWTIKIPGNKLCEDGVDIKKLPVDTVICGHIHNRILPEYTGSCWPNKSSEMDIPDTKLPRCYKVWDTKSNKIDCVPWPIFLSYENIEYPNKIEEVPNCNYSRVFTVYNIKNKLEAVDYYSGHWIKSTFIEKDKSTKDNIMKSDEADIFLFKDNKEAFHSMIKEQNLKVSRQAIKIVTDLL